MMMINSPATSSSAHTDSAKRLRLTIPRNNKIDLLNNSKSISPSKLDENHHHMQQKTLDCTNTMKQQLSPSIDNENDTTLLTTTTTTTTVEVKVKTTKTSSASSSRKRKLNLDDETIDTTSTTTATDNHHNNNNDDDDDVSKQTQSVNKKKKKPRSTNNDTITNDQSLNNDSNHQTLPKTVDKSSVTDESSFGSCEPGTSVVLQGIVWNETDKGVLVVNITWRGKTYVGALLNTTEQNWAPPRYKSDVRTTKHSRHNNNHHHNHNRDYLLTSITSSSSATHSQSNTNHSSSEPAERILRNGKRRGTYTTVTPNAASKSNSFKIPEAPPSKTDEISSTDKLTENGSGAPSSSSTSVNDEDETNSISGEKTLVRNGVDDETGDNCSSRSVSPTTSGASTTSSSPPPSIQEKPTLPPPPAAAEKMNHHTIEPAVPTIPMDLSNSRTTTVKIDENSSSFNSIIQTTSPPKSLSSPSLPPSFLSSFTNKSSKSKGKDTLSTPPSLLSPHPFNNGMLFSPPTHPANYFPSSPFLHAPPNAFGLSPFHPHHSPTSSLHSNPNKNKLSPNSSTSSVSPSSYLSLPPQLFFNPLTTPRFPSVCSSPSSLSKSSR